MNKEGQLSERFPRREFFRKVRRAGEIVVGVVGASILGSACGPTPEKPGAKPTSLPEQTEIPKIEAQPSPVVKVEKVVITPPSIAVPKPPKNPTEVSKPTPEVIVTYRSVPPLVDQKFWKSVFAGIGGENEKITLTPGPNGEQLSGALKDYLEYASLVFRRKIDLKDLTEDSLVALQCWSAMVQRMGIEGITPDFSQVFPKFEEFKGYRITFNNLSPGDGGKLETVIKNSTPSEAIFRNKTHFTLWGVSTDKSGTFALGFFDEGFKREGKGESEVLYQYPVIIPLDSTEGSLKSLFEANGVSFETDKNEQGNVVLKLKRDGETFNLIPSRTDKELADLFKKKAGALWVDQRQDRTWYPNPVVPYLPEAFEKLVGENYVVEKVVDKTGERVVVKNPISGKEIYEAKYNEKTKEWVWEKIVEKLKAPQIAGLVYNEQDKKYYAEKQNSYGLKEKDYAGETIEYTFENEKTMGLVLTPEVVKVLMDKVNTSEAIAKSEWKIPFPLDAKGEKNLEIREWVPGILKYVFFVIKGLSPNAKFISPFREKRTIVHANAPGFGLRTGMDLPSNLTKGEIQRLGFLYPEGSIALNEGKAVGLSDVILERVTGSLGPKAPAGTQAIVYVAPGPDYTEKSDFDITDNILEIEGKKVFLASLR